MTYDKDYKGCLLIIRELDTGNVINKAIITNYDRNTMRISIKESTFCLNDIPRVLLNIFYGESICECMGTVRKMLYPPLREISIYKESFLSDRRSKRYPAKLTAAVEEIIYNQESGYAFRLKSPVEVVVLDISSTGALLQANCIIFAPGVSFKLKLIMGDTIIYVNTTIVRINKERKKETRINGNMGIQIEINKETEYGCQFNYIYD